MLVKKFEAPSLEQALTQVKSEMGPNALILATSKRSGKWFKKGSIEVTAAYEKNPPTNTKRDHFDEEELNKVFPYRRRPGDGTLAAEATSSQGPTRPAGARYFDAVKGGTVTRDQPVRTVQPDRYESDFLSAGFSVESARELSRRLVFDFPAKDLKERAFFDRTRAKLIAGSLRTLSIESFEAKSSWAAIGPPGSGKTSLLVKIALLLRDRKKSARLVSCDQRKVLGRSELSAYSKLIQVPFSTDGKSTPGGIELVDTPSLLLNSEDSDEEISSFSRDRHSVLVLDAGMRVSESLKFVCRAERFAPSAIAFTKLDCVAEHGSIYDILKSTKLPLLALSMTGAFKDSLRFLEPADLARLLIEGTLATRR